MLTNETKRDRAYVRHVHIKEEDKDRFYEYLKTIDRPKFIIGCRIQGNIHIFHLKIKRQEELYIELAFDTTIKKPRVCKVKNIYGNMVWRTV